MSDEAERHWHDSDGLKGGCYECQRGLKFDFARRLIDAITDQRSEDVVRSIDEILDEWPR